MTPLRQFQTLFAYHAMANPWIWVFPIAFLPQAVVGSFGEYRDNLIAANLTTVTLLWIPLLFSSFLFGSQVLASRSSLSGSAQLQVQTYNSEFLLTRAVDRASVYWARVAVYWILILVPVAVWIIIGLKEPSLSLLLSPERASYYLGSIPGSSVQSILANGDQTLIAPHGGLLLKFWAAFLLIFSGAFAQFFTFAISTLRGAKVYHWTLYIAVIVLLCITPFFGGSILERMFLLAVNHGILCGVALVAAVAFSLWFSKKRFLDQEF